MQTRRRRRPETRLFRTLLGAGDIDFERFRQGLRRVGHVHPGGGALDLIGVAVLGGRGFSAWCTGRVAQRGAADVAEFHLLDLRRVGITQLSTQALRRVTDRDLDVSPHVGTRDGTLDVLVLTVDGDLGSARQMPSAASVADVEALVAELIAVFAVSVAELAFSEADLSLEQPVSPPITIAVHPTATTNARSPTLSPLCSNPYNLAGPAASMDPNVVRIRRTDD